MSAAPSRPAWSCRLGAAAVRALHAELALEPKPGLVSLRDSGSHEDMDAATFTRSLFSLRGYFKAAARAGAADAPFETLRQLGLQAEARMLRATGGANTHRGAVFLLGLLCAAAGRLPGPADAATLRRSLHEGYGPALAAHAAALRAAPARSHGQRAARAHGLRSASEEAADGFPTLFRLTLPTLRRTRAAGAGERAARVQALMATLAVLDDTCLVHRGGIDGLRWAQGEARAFLAAGGVRHPDWLARGRALHGAFVAQRLSPGGAADLLGAACWLDAVLLPAEAPDPVLRATPA